MRVKPIHKHFTIKQSDTDVVSSDAFLTTFKAVYNWYLFINEHFVLKFTSHGKTNKSQPAINCTYCVLVLVGEILSR